MPDLLRETANWKLHRAVLQYFGAPPWPASIEDERVMLEHGYVPTSRVAEERLLTITFSPSSWIAQREAAAAQAQREAAAAQAQREAAAAQHEAEKFGSGKLDLKLNLPEVHGTLTAVSDGWKSSWYVYVHFPAPDHRYVAASATLRASDVADLRRLLEQANSVLAALPEGFVGEFSRIIGRCSGIEVSVVKASARAAVRLRATSRTEWTFGPDLSPSDVRKWIEGLTLAEARGPELEAQFKSLPP